MRSILIFSLLFCGYDAFKILVYSPIFGHSHTNFMGKIADALTERGHNVTLLMPIQNYRLMDKTGVKLTKNVIILPPHPKVREMVDEAENNLFKKLWSMEASPFSMLSMVSNMTFSFVRTCENVLTNDTLLSHLQNEKFDIGIGEPFTICSFGLFELMKIPVTIGTLSVSSKELISTIIGEPIFPSYVPAGMGQFGNNMTFIQRIKNFLGLHAGDYFFRKVFDQEIELFKTYHDRNFRHYSDILADVSFMFTNSNPYLSFSRPMISKTIEIGGIVVDEDFKSSKNLGEFDQILNERKKNVLVSFGSVAKSKDMPEEYKKSLLAVFEEMKDVTFIWKYEEDTDIADHLPNVHLVKWMPQVALLNDPRLNLFITHGGLGSTTEVAYLGKPAVFIPLFADQVRNSKMLTRYGGSIDLSKHDLKDKKMLSSVISRALNDKTFTEKAQKLSEILNSAPNNPKETFVKHVEFAGKVGRISNLDSYARHLNIIQFYSIDVIFTIISIILTVLYIIYIIILFIYKMFRNKSKKKCD